MTVTDMHYGSDFKHLPMTSIRSGTTVADPGVDGGMVSRVSRFFPHQPIDPGSNVPPFQASDRIPGLPGWVLVPAPGHSPRHVSFLRPADRAMVAGDASITCRQDVLHKVLTQIKEVQGPPRYFTPDWNQARDSARALADLDPTERITGRGQPMGRDELNSGLRHLAAHFDEIALPDHGKYVPEEQAGS